MEFFEQLGKKISSTSQSAVQKTKDFADTTKLNSAISDNKKKISSLCLSLGQAYYEDHKEETISKYSETIKQINVLYAEINENKEKIKQIKGIVKCPKCGADVEKDDSFCSVCGTKVDK